MKNINLLVGCLLISSAAFSQIGIGTSNPNEHALLDLTTTAPTYRGILLPRMSSTERNSMNLSMLDAGMMVYQTSAPKGIYTFDGSTWLNNSMTDPGTNINNTLRWDNSLLKWVPTSNIYNGGGSIGIGSFTTGSPNYQLHVHSGGANHTRLQITSGATASVSTDGLLIGIGNTLIPGVAHIIQQENKPMWFGTNGLERVRIDSVGRVGINQANPSSTLDINGSLKVDGAVNLAGTVTTTGSLNTAGPMTATGAFTSTGPFTATGTVNTSNTLNANGPTNLTGTVTTLGTVNHISTVNASGTVNLNGSFKLGNNSTTLTNIIRTDVSVDPPPLNSMEEWPVEIPLANTVPTAVVYVSPNTDLDGYMICYARISAPGMLKVKFLYMGEGPSDLGWITLRVAVIQ